ncbi:MAG TPA: hypothetical protein PKA12_06085 [Saprospiraceae bacterium]|nr:hypothetical protein [Saprospiraceae bacterium]
MQTSVKLYLGLSLFLFISCKKNIPVSQPEKEAIYSQYDAFDFQAEGMKTFNTEPEKSKNAFLKAAKAYLQNKMQKDAGICLGNVAHLYEEQFQKPDSALLLSQQSLDYALASNDTLNTSHGYRYTGYLTGILGKVDEGIDLIKKSYPYYEMMRNKDGIYVSMYDMARVYGENGRYEEATEVLNESTNHFKTKTNLQRIFNNNVYALKMYHATSNKKEFERVRQENESLIQTGKINPTLQQKYIDMLNETK